MLKIADLQKKTRTELLNEISHLKGKLLALRFENATGQLKENHLISETKQDIAKVFTVIKEKEMSSETTTSEKTTKKAEASAKPAKEASAKTETTKAMKEEK